MAERWVVVRGFRTNPALTLESGIGRGKVETRGENIFDGHQKEFFVCL
jgi:hypothetical protein